MKRAATKHPSPVPTASPRLVICCGMIRSGSTLQYQLASEILSTAGPLQKLGFLAPNEKLPADWDQNGTTAICKLHHWDESLADLLKNNRAVAFYCFRDLRDVAVSSMRKFEISFENLWEQKWLSDSVTQGEHWLASPNVYSTSYELMIRDLESEIRRMAQWIGILLAPEKVASLALNHSFKSQKSRAAKLASADKLSYDPHTLLHPDHLHDGKIGGWREILTEKQARLISDEFANWFDLRGYSPKITIPATPPPAPKSKDTREVFVPHCGWFTHSEKDEVAQLLREGHYEADLQAFFWLYLRPGDHVIDVGSHFGLYSRLASEVVTATGSVLAIEPHPETQTHLAVNLARLTQASLVKVALGNQEGTAELAMGHTGYSAHSYLAAESSGATAKVEVSTLAKLITDAKWKEVGLVKIDTEGREFDVVEGAGALLGSPVLPVITLEFSEKNLLHFGRTTQQLARTLRQKGYQVCRFATDNLQLVPVSDDIWPVWYENFAAVLDIDSVNRRLNSAAADHRRIAMDILARANACQRVQELSQLATYREQATQSLVHKKWAETAEANLATERQRAADFEKWAFKAEAQAKQNARLLDEHRRWAETAEAALATEKQRAADFEKWALKAEAQAKQNARLLDEHRRWAETAEAALATERRNVRDLEAWAVKTEKLLATERQRAADFEKWALKAEAQAKQNARLLDEHRRWAETAEAALATERRNVRDLEAWAVKTEKLLATEKQRAADFEKWALKAEAQAEQNAKLLNENKRWAETAEANLSTERSLSKELKTWAEAAEARIRQEREIVQSHKAWAERTETFLAQARNELAENKNRAERLELQLAEANLAKHPPKT